MRWLLAYAIIALGATPGYAGVVAVNIYEPRAFGYFIGDTLERRVEVVTTGGTELFTEALPHPGPLTYWLDLVSIDQKSSVSGDRKTYEITLKYQTFYSALDTRNVEIPAVPLKFSGPKDDTASKGDSAAPAASIPAFKFLMSPIRDIVLQSLNPGANTEIGDVLRPDVKARTISADSALKLFAISLVALVLSAAGLLRHYAKWPFARRPGRPFTIADRKIGDLDEGNRELAYRDSLIILHRAFDDSVGRRVFAADLPALLKQRHQLAKLTPSLHRFFESSRLYFFSQDRSAAEANFPIEDLRRLASDLARQERAAA
jgi:mxaA protein